MQNIIFISDNKVPYNFHDLPQLITWYYEQLFDEPIFISKRK